MPARMPANMPAPIPRFWQRCVAMAGIVMAYLSSALRSRALAYGAKPWPHGHARSWHGAQACVVMACIGMVCAVMAQLRMVRSETHPSQRLWAAAAAEPTAWHGMAWHGMALHGMARQGIARCSAVARHGAHTWMHAHTHARPCRKNHIA